ncbi:hypothetical protein [Streptomyces sp. TRM49041]|uniref:hypothetical protein n=1 Tax=Streptomyces sp. TRM49041 TaxID=2603216 RepID=UPI0011EF0212|nr:hypothetical protein [Streptomyces sp. TRM49041]
MHRHDTPPPLPSQVQAQPQAQPQAPSPSPGGAPHDTATAERGAFALARCTCGWSGPARRSRDRARTDAAAHMSEQGGGVRQ